MGTTVLVIIVLAIIYFGWAGVVIVRQQEAYVVERLGRFKAVLSPGLKFIIPFIDRVAYRHTLKEQSISVEDQMCITRDNIQLTVDGILFCQVTDPKLASYGVVNYRRAIVQLTQTTLRSIIGRMELDRLFEEREEINRTVVNSLDEACVAWGVKVLRYEVQKLDPPHEIQSAMQAQVVAERQKRARIATSEGSKIESINIAQGQREAEIKTSEGQKISQINRAQGEAESLRLVAQATADALDLVAAAVNKQGGMEAVNFKIAQQFVDAFKGLAKTSNTLILPSNVADIGSLVASAMTVVKAQNKVPPAPPSHS